MQRLARFGYGLLLSTAVLSAANASPRDGTVATVGAGEGCDFTDLQAAVDAVNAGPQIIHVQTDYAGGAIRIVDRDVTIVGGFAECGDADPQDDAQTMLDGALSSADSPVIAIDSTAAPRQIVLQHLALLRGHQAAGDGGGIAITGSGKVSIDHTLIQNNDAANGGGINADGSGLNVAIGSYTQIVVNTTGGDGGGIRVAGQTTLTILPAFVMISGNTAGGNGGGLAVTGPLAHAEIGSPGFNDGGVIAYNNATRNGGGIAVEHGGVVRLFAADASKPTPVQSNSAVLGGAVYIGAQGAGGPGTLCGFGYGMQYNGAVDGGAIFADADQANSGRVLLGRGGVTRVLHDRPFVQRDHR
jgi:hypothetical protein